MIRFIIRRREHPIPYSHASLISIFVSILISLAILTMFGINPVIAVWEAFIYPLISGYGWSGVLRNALPLLLCGIGLIIAFRAGVWNIGAEGQMLLGAIVATWVALYFMPDKPSIIVIPLMFVLGFIAGGVWGLIAGILKSKWNVNEVLTTMMLNYVAYQLVYYLVMGPWQDPVTNYPVTKPFPPNACLPKISKTFPVPIPTLIIAIISALFVYVLLFHSKLGYEIRAIGSNPDAAKAYGISYEKIVMIAMFLSGGFAGLAGVNAVAGAIPAQLRRPEQVSRGYGFIAILVAWLAGLHPIAAILTSILMGIFFIAGSSIEIIFHTGVETTNLFIGSLLLVLSVAETLRHYSIRVKFTSSLFKIGKKSSGG